MRSPEINEIMTALSKAQGQMEGADKNSENPHFRSRYADLKSVWESCRIPLSSNGLAVTQTIRSTGSGLELVTILGHSSGQWISSSIPLPNALDKIQAFGSALTYARRYGLSSIVGVYPDEDDDGEAAMTLKPVTEPIRRVKINEDQAKFINAYLEEFPDSRNEFLNRYGVREVKDIPCDQYNEIISIFLKKRKLKDVPNG